MKKNVFLPSEFMDANNINELIKKFNQYRKNGIAYAYGRGNTYIDINTLIKRLEYYSKCTLSLEEIYSNIWDEMQYNFI